MDLEISYTKEDWQKFQGYLEKEITKTMKAPWGGILLNTVIWVLIGIILIFFFRYVGQFHWPSGVLVGVTCAVIFVVFIQYLSRLKNAFAPSGSGTFLGHHRFVFSETGIESQSDGFTGAYDWSTINNIVRADGMIMLFIDTAYAFIFPENKLDNSDEFYDYIVRCHAEAVANINNDESRAGS